MSSLHRLVSSALGLALLLAAQGQTHEDHDQAPAAPPNRDPFQVDGTIDDRAVGWLLIERGEELIRSGRNVPAARLLKQANQADGQGCRLELERPSRWAMSSERLLRRHRASILVLGHVYQCDRCPRYHARTDTGFVLTRSGAVATCLHSLQDKNVLAVVALTGDGRVAPVVEVLAADPAADLVIMQMEGEGYLPLPVAANAPAGAQIRVLSHPDRNYFTLTSGVVSRYSIDRVGEATLVRMAVTAGFAKGSSGAPVLDERGGVVGLVVSTRSIYYHVENGRKDNLQMVIRHCVPASYLLELIDGD